MDKEFFADADNERSPFDGPDVQSFSQIWRSIPELYRSMLPDRDAAVQIIPQASAQALCKKDLATDQAYA